MAWPRFYVENLPALGTIVLDEDESRHASGVLRMSVKDDCLAFDGCGGEARCTVSKVSKRAVELQIVERLDTDRELAKKTYFAVALPKGDRQKTLIDFMVPLGVYSFQPLLTKRGVAQPVDAALARLRRSVLEASKQCGRNHLMQVLEPLDLAQVVKPASAEPNSRSENSAQGDLAATELRIFAHPYGATQRLHALQSVASLASSVRVLIGPEGGFTEEEAQALRTAGWTATSLGPRIMRVEVAATHVASWLAEVT
ncbi:MAG: RsmE family RNA methyltransferase [Pirellulaceae bacterium]|nr:RsmE family RNA methyltransferase [Pirellulaceae bacterium]